MKNLPIKPTLIPTLFTIPALIVLLILGSWQVQRLHWKEALIQDVDNKLQQEAVPLPEEIQDVSPLQYQKISIEGTFIHEKEVHLYTGPREFKGKPGYDIITPLQRSDGKGIVFINRGWVPEVKKKSEDRPETLVKGVQHIEGLILEGETARWFTPENDKNNNVWLWMDLPSMAQFAGMDVEPVIVLQIGKQQRDVYPIPATGKVEIRNDHLQYVITWFSLAFILLVIYIIYHWKPEGTRA